MGSLRLSSWLQYSKSRRLFLQSANGYPDCAAFETHSGTGNLPTENADHNRSRSQTDNGESVTPEGK